MKAANARKVAAKEETRSELAELNKVLRKKLDMVNTNPELQEVLPPRPFFFCSAAAAANQLAMQLPIGLHYPTPPCEKGYLGVDGVNRLQTCERGCLGVDGVIMITNIL